MKARHQYRAILGSEVSPLDLEEAIRLAHSGRPFRFEVEAHGVDRWLPISREDLEFADWIKTENKKGSTQ